MDAIYLRNGTRRACVGFCIWQNTNFGWVFLKGRSPREWGQGPWYPGFRVWGGRYWIARSTEPLSLGLIFTTSSRSDIGYGLRRAAQRNRADHRRYLARVVRHRANRRSRQLFRAGRLIATGNAGGRARAHRAQNRLAAAPLFSKSRLSPSWRTRSCGKRMDNRAQSLKNRPQ